MAKQRVQTGNAPAAIGPYSQGIKASGFLYTAGQVGIDPEVGKLIEGGIIEQTRRALDNLSAILDAAGTSMQSVIKTTVFLTDMGHFKSMNEVYGEYFGDGAPPARSTVQVAGLPLGAVVEIECVALLPSDTEKG